MEYRTLGRTGIRVPEVGFGCGNVGGLMVRGSLDEQVMAVQRALDLGVNYFDTAPSYGDTLSETNLGLVLKELRPQVHVATKVHVRDDGLKDIRGTVRRSIEDSLRRLGRELGVDYVLEGRPRPAGRGCPNPPCAHSESRASCDSGERGP